MKIADLQVQQSVTVVARIRRVFDTHGKSIVAELQDDTGTVLLTAWDNYVPVIKQLAAGQCAQVTARCKMDKQCRLELTVSGDCKSASPGCRVQLVKHPPRSLQNLVNDFEVTLLQDLKERTRCNIAAQIVLTQPLMKVPCVKLQDGTVEHPVSCALFGNYSQLPLAAGQYVLLTQAWCKQSPQGYLELTLAADDDDRKLKVVQDDEPHLSELLARMSSLDQDASTFSILGARRWTPVSFSDLSQLETHLPCRVHMRLQVVAVLPEDWLQCTRKMCKACHAFIASCHCADKSVVVRFVIALQCQDVDANVVPVIVCGRDVSLLLGVTDDPADVSLQELREAVDSRLITDSWFVFELLVFEQPGGWSLRLLKWQE